MKTDLKNIPCFGIAGNFTGHLEQAGEAAEFQNVKTKEKNAPKAIFPTYIPNAKNPAPEFLGVFPFDSGKIIFPHGEEKLQIEPECALIFNAEWSDGKLKSLNPVKFAASNDCSIRKAGAKKISMKKNWGKSSKGISETLISIDEFSEEGILAKYRIACFLLREGKIFEYGEDSPVKGYSYIFEELINWLIEKFNTQKDEGTTENIGSYLVATGLPEQIMVSIGATRYTKFGETNFLKDGDESIVILYPEHKYTNAEIKEIAAGKYFAGNDTSILRQKIIVQ